MKKFIGGFLAGTILFGTAGALAATYVATPRRLSCAGERIRIYLRPSGHGH